MKFPKLRKFWKRNPVTKIKKSDKVYSRQRSKEEEIKAEKEESSK